MKPGYIFYINGIDYTGVLQDRFQSLTLEDTAGFNNDRLDITLDAVPAIEIPKRGAIATLFLGYTKGTNMSDGEGMVKMGQFVFDESRVSKSKRAGRMVSFHFHALSTGSMWKETHNTTYDNKSLAQIVEYVAQRNGLEPIVDPSFWGIQVQHIAQHNESDQSFLTALGIKYGANFKVSGDTLLFAKVGIIQELSDTIQESDCSAWEWLNQSTSNYGAVVARSYDKDTGKYSYKAEVVRTNSEESARKENARLTLPGVYATEELASAAAVGRASVLGVQGHSFNFELYRGNPLLKAEMMLNAQGFYPVDSGVQMPTYWHLTKVTHSLTKNGGYITSGSSDKPVANQSSTANLTPEQQKAANEAAAAQLKALRNADKAILKNNAKERKKLSQ